MKLENKSVQELEDLLTMLNAKIEKKKVPIVKLSGKRYLQIEKTIHCRTCGSTSICLSQLSRGEDTTTVTEDGQIIVTKWKNSSEVILLDSFTYKCKYCRGEIEAWSRAELERRFLDLACYSQRAIFGTGIVPPPSFKPEPRTEAQLCLNLMLQ